MTGKICIYEVRWQNQSKLSKVRCSMVWSRCFTSSSSSMSSTVLSEETEICWCYCLRENCTGRHAGSPDFLHWIRPWYRTWQHYIKLDDRKINIYWVKWRQIVVSYRKCAALSCLSKQKRVHVIILRNAALAEERPVRPFFAFHPPFIVSIDNVVILGAKKRNLKVGSSRHWIPLWCRTGYTCIEIYGRCMESNTKNPAYLCRTAFD